MWQGYLDTQEWRHMQAMLTVRNIALETVHASGHISLPDLEDAVRAIAPRKLMFMHTNEPQGVRGHFQNLGFEVVNQRDGEEIRV
jgi:ribonuclease J